MTEGATSEPPTKIGFLALGALGVVFGDIGTSPLYTLHQCFGGRMGVAPTHQNVVGVLSLVFWALTMVVSVKYLAFVLRADNHGEGGIFALLALLPHKARRSGDERFSREPARWMALLAIAGAALLYGDGMITPAISVLSAVEGLEVAAPTLHALVVPLTCAILIGLFSIQRRGTPIVGSMFGPVMALWFLALGVLGAHHLWRNPSVLAALDPLRGVRFFLHHRARGVAVLGSVVLAVTGGEALYADLGDFGRRPIRVAWFALVMPALVLSYFGQGARLLVDPDAREHPFFALIPAGPWTYVLVVLATAATVIASQALISGAFSMTHQAIQLGYLPRLTIRHTSRDAEGQVYIPQVNWVLASACAALVLAFRRSDRLGAAYGLAVTGTMVITTLMFFAVARTAWRWPFWKALLPTGAFLAFDLPFLGASLTKVREGGFVPLLVGGLLFAAMATWSRGRSIHRAHLADRAKPVEDLIAGRQRGEPAPARSAGTGVFLSSYPVGLPPVVLDLVQLVRVLPETVILLTIEVMHVPHLGEDEMSSEDLGHGLFRLRVRRGFMDVADVPRLLRAATVRFRLPADPDTATYYIGRDRILATPTGEMGRLRKALFGLLARAARPPTDPLRIPPHQVVEIGSKVEL